MGLWQRGMIALARNRPIGAFMQRRSISSLAGRFVGGEDLDAAIATAAALRDSGRLSSLFFLGEYVEDPAAVARTVTELQAAIAALAGAGLDVHVSVDPTAVGWMTDRAICRTNVFALGRAVAATAGSPGVERRYLMLDMEDSSLTDDTIAMYEDLRSTHVPAAVTLQAYLHRFEGDVRRCVCPGGAVRLVKGARDLGFYPIFATHDAGLIREIIGLARRLGWPAGRYEFEMLYGVRPRLQHALLSRGERLRLYVPYGAAWWPYAVRRVGEAPRNAGLLLRAVLLSR